MIGYIIIMTILGIIFMIMMKEDWRNGILDIIGPTIDKIFNKIDKAANTMEKGWDPKHKITKEKWKDPNKRFTWW